MARGILESPSKEPVFCYLLFSKVLTKSRCYSKRYSVKSFKGAGVVLGVVR